jgi:hypothetical protein
MDRNKARLIETEMLVLLKPLEAKYGVSVRMRGGRYTDTDLMAKVEIAEKGSSGEVLNREATELRDHAELFNLPKDAYGKKVRVGQTEYTLIGINPRCWKAPLLGKRSDGKVYKLTVDLVRAALGLPIDPNIDRFRHRNSPYDD